MSAHVKRFLNGCESNLLSYNILAIFQLKETECLEVKASSRVEHFKHGIRQCK